MTIAPFRSKNDAISKGLRMMTMDAYQVVTDQGLDDVRRTKVPRPKLGPGKVLVDLRAASLNYRDLIIPSGGYPGSHNRPVILGSDGAGEVVAVGPGVTRWNPGDRVMTNFMNDWIAGELTDELRTSALGGGQDGILSEQFVLPEHGLIRIPDHLSYEEASTLPCAAVTAWHALTAANTKAGDTVLVLGTGGVSIFTIQLARMIGAIPIVTSSSDAKLQKVAELGAEHSINYKAHSEWQNEVMRLTSRRGVDHVLETGGTGTLARSLQSVRVGGTISLIGVLPGGSPPDMTPALLKGVTVRGINVGSAEMFESMNRAISANGLKPVIHQVFPFDNVIGALRALQDQTHVGKIVIARDSE